MKTVVIDAGHGGTDPGAVGNGLQEKNICLNRAVRLRNYLESQYVGVRVRMTRETDIFVPIGTRARFSNGHGADVFISLHVNAAEATSARGFETFIHASRSAGATRLQQAIHSRVAGELRDTPNRGMKTANFQVLRETNAPAILMEEAFISNSQDAALLRNEARAERYVQLMGDGIAAFLGLQRGSNPQPAPPAGGDVTFRVVTGSFQSRDFAEARVEQLRRLGFESFIVVERK